MTVYMVRVGTHSIEIFSTKEAAHEYARVRMRRLTSKPYLYGDNPRLKIRIEEKLLY